MLTIKDAGGAVIVVRSGRDSIDWSHDVRIIGDEMSWTFESDGSVNGWGFKFTVNPVMRKKLAGETKLSDRSLQSHPSIDLVTCLLDFQLGSTLNQDSVSRLAAALAACAQLSTLDAKQRTWAIQQLRQLMSSAVGTAIVGGAVSPMEDYTKVSVTERGGGKGGREREREREMIPFNSLEVAVHRCGR